MNRPTSISPFGESIEIIRDSSTASVNKNVEALLKRVEKANLPPLYEMPATKARAEFDRRATKLELEAEVVEHCEDMTIKKNYGRQINLRLYRGIGCTNAALIFYVHGGGWVFGSVEGYDQLCRRFANRTRLPIVSIEYSLAPEHPAPTALEDISRTISMRSSLAHWAGVGTEKWAMMGDSAGGNLIAATLLELGTEDSPDQQTLIYPVTDLSRTAPSRMKFSEGYLLDAKMMSWFSRHYVGDGDAADPRISPIRHTQLDKSPPTLMVTAGLDPLRDEGIEYATALHKAGVQIDHLHCPDMLHGFLGMPLALPTALVITDRIADYLRAFFAEY